MENVEYEKEEHYLMYKVTKVEQVESKELIKTFKTHTRYIIESEPIIEEQCKKEFKNRLHPDYKNWEDLVEDELINFYGIDQTMHLKVGFLLETVETGNMIKNEIKGRLA